MTAARFIDNDGFPAPSMQGWEPIVIPRAEIEARIEQLVQAPRPENGIRSFRIVHPQAPEPSFGLAPSIDATIEVLKPGEETHPVRHNASQVTLCVRGSGSAVIGKERFSFERLDTWNTPGMHPYAYRNEGTDLQVRLIYSNGAILRSLMTHYVEHLSESGFWSATASSEDAPAKDVPALPPPILLGGGAQLLTYEHLIAPPVVENRALHWAWKDIEAQRDAMFSGKALDNKGRRGILVMYNPATGRLLGTTHNVFSNFGFMPADVLDFPHRHSSNAITYAVDGAFVSEVNGKLLEWAEGDIAYTAPGWSAHANGSRTGGTAFVVQDHPFQIATECLIWQEGEGKPIRLLGAEAGFRSDDNKILRKAGD